MQRTTTTGSPKATVDWRHRAVCRDVDPEQFFPAAEAGPAHDAQVAVAKAICVGCPVRAECLEFALTALSDGIAAGLTPDERRRLRSRWTGGPTDGSGRGMAAAGRAAIRSGRPAPEVAREFGVAPRTAQRWAAQVRAEATAANESRQGRGAA